MFTFSLHQIISYIQLIQPYWLNHCLLQKITLINSFYSDILKKEPDTYHLSRLLAEIEYLWEKIGHALCVKDPIIEGLRTDVTRPDNHSKLWKVLQEWKDSKCSDVTWSKIITELEGPLFNNRRIANDIRSYLSQL